jgi:hypothetical protein
MKSKGNQAKLFSDIEPAFCMFNYLINIKIEFTCNITTK